MKKELHAIVIGDMSHEAVGERLFCYENEVMPTSAKWIMDMAKKNGLFFYSSEEARSFRDEVIDFAKKLYADKQREKVEQERELMIAEREQKYEEWLKKKEV